MPTQYNDNGTTRPGTGPLWSRTVPPIWRPNAIATKQGWVDPVTGEILVAIGQGNGVPLDHPQPTAAPHAISGNWVAPVLFSGDPATATTLYPVTGHYVTGNTIVVTVTYNTPVTVSGTITFPLKINGVVHNMPLGNGNGTATLQFYYTVVSTDSATAGQVTVGAGSALTLGVGSTLVDEGGVAVAVTVASLAAAATASLTAVYIN